MSSTHKPKRKSSAMIMSALMLGLPLGVGMLTFMGLPMWEGTLVERYSRHPVEVVEILLFCCAVGALLGKLWNHLWQRRGMRADLLPEWDGQPCSASEAPVLMGHLSRVSRLLQGTWVAQRVRAILDFVCQRRSAAELDDHMRSLSDTDAMAVESSYSLIRFLIWSMPILGFLGTVLGIAGAIAGVSPEVLEQSIGTVTQGLATAFDTTGLALILTIVTMFLTFVMERMEQGLLERVDAYAELHLAHRFARPAGEHGPYMEALQQSSQVVIRATESMVRKQAELWAETLAETESRRERAEAEQQARFARALEQAMEQSLAKHREQLESMEQPLGGLAHLEPLAHAMHAMTRSLAQLQKQEGQLIRLQQLLQQSLAGIASAGSFEEAVHSLTGAVHLLTAKSASLAPRLKLHSDDSQPA